MCSNLFFFFTEFMALAPDLHRLASSFAEAFIAPGKIVYMYSKDASRLTKFTISFGDQLNSGARKRGALRQLPYNLPVLL